MFILSSRAAWAGPQTALQAVTRQWGRKLHHVQAGWASCCLIGSVNSIPGV